MDPLKNLELTEDDFNLLNEGLDLIPKHHQMGDSISSLFMGALFKDDDENDKSLELKRMKRRREKEAEMNLQKENIRILQAKLIQFKRLLREQDLLKETTEILNQK